MRVVVLFSVGVYDSLLGFDVAVLIKFDEGVSDEIATCLLVLACMRACGVCV